MTPDLPPPGLLRRLGAMFYDSLLLLALLMMLSYPYVWLTGGDKPGLVVKTAYQIYLLAICFFYFAGFWVRGGQTLGLRTWRMKLVTTDGGPITWADCAEAFCLRVDFPAVPRSGISVGAPRPRQAGVA